MLQQFVDNSALEDVTVDASHQILLEYLIKDGIIEYRGAPQGAFYFGPGEGPNERAGRPEHHGPAFWGLKESGVELVARLRGACEID